MKFIELANLFEKLESKSKRLEKIMILRDFLEEKQEEAYVIFDMVSGNFQRNINKKNLGISLKTILHVLSFVSKESIFNIEKKFNKLGDVGIVAKDALISGMQTSLVSTDLKLDDIINALNEISIISGNNSNKKKIEILSNLFLSAKTDVEYKFLARFLMDDLRIGVSDGVLRESCVNAYFPRLIGIHNYCKSCDYFSLNLKKCIKCSKIFEKDNVLEEKLIESKYLIVEINTPKNIVGLNEFIGEKEESEKIKFILRINRKTNVIKSENPREIYNLFLKLFEKKYNLINNFEMTLKQINIDLQNILNAEIDIFRPIKSMLGTRVNTVYDAFEVTDSPAFVDFKYDGLRVQIHNNYGEIKLFSRNLDDITKQFPEVVEYIKNNFSDVSFVVDSECVGYDYDTHKFLDFQVLSRRIMTKNYSDVSHINVAVKFFDMMYFDGETLLDEPYEFRRKKIEKLLLNRDLVQKLNFDINLLSKFKLNFDY